MATEKDSWADFGGATNSASDGAWADFASFGTSNASAFGTSDAFSQSTPAFPAFDSNTTASTDSAFSVGHQPVRITLPLPNSSQYKFNLPNYRKRPSRKATTQAETSHRLGLLRDQPCTTNSKLLTG